MRKVKFAATVENAVRFLSATIETQGKLKSAVIGESASEHTAEFESKGSRQDFRVWLDKILVGFKKGEITIVETE